MVLIDKMKNFKIMRMPTFLPTLERDKKKKSAALLLTPNFDSSKKLINSNLFINKKRFESYYMERDISFYIGKEKIEDVEESAILETKRSELPDSAFGVPSKRKFPLDTEAHVRSAIKFFNYVDPEDEAELARRIIAAMKKFNITDVKVSEKNRFSKYYHPKKSTNEEFSWFNNPYIEEANDYTKYQSNFKKKSSSIDYNIIDINDPTAKDYLESNAECKKHISYLSNNTGEIIVDKDSDKLIGYIWVGKTKDPGFISTLHVNKEYRGYGFGDILVNDAVKKYNAIDLIVDKANTVAFEMYKSHGFVPIKEVNDGKSYWMKLKSKLNSDESIIKEATEVSIKKLYHVSANNLDGKEVLPSIPSNFLTKNGYEEDETSRVCFSTSVDGCLMGLSQNLENKEFYVYSPDDISKYTVLKPTKSEVPDCEITKEHWICSPVIMKVIGKIKVTDSTGDGIPYTYGDNTAELYKWNWEWIEKVEENYEIFHNYFKINHDGSATLNGKDVDINTIESQVHFPIPLSYFPNNMGINLNSVDSMEWDLLTNGELVNIIIKFHPAFDNCDDLEYHNVEEAVSEIEFLGEYINEGYVINEKDILYNKEAFDNGDINLCFVTGLSGSGKSTLANKMEAGGVEKYELDDVLANWAFSDDNLKEYGDLISSFFKGPGKKYRYTSEQEFIDNDTEDLERYIIRDFVSYTMNWAKSHKSNKFVLEGVELYWFYKPEELKDYAVYIKGTSTLLSMIRSAKRDSSDAETKGQRVRAFLKNLMRRDRAHAYTETEKLLKTWRQYYTGLMKDSVKESLEDWLIESAISEAGALNIGDTLLFFNEANDVYTPQLRKILFQSRIKNRKELMVHLASVKEQIPWIKFIFPDIRRFQQKNLYVDLSYYTNIFFNNNTWVQQRAFNLFTEFMKKILNHPNLSNAGYTKKTIFIPVTDWIVSKDPNFWNYRKSLTPISCIYQMMFDGNSRYLKEAFGDLDIIFVGDSNYFKVNFSQIDPKDYKKDSVLFRNFIRKMVFNETFDDSEIDTGAENIDSKEVIQNKIIDKIEASRGVDLTSKVYDANKNLQKVEKVVKAEIKKKDITDPVEKVATALDIDHKAMTATKQDKVTKDEIKKKQEEKAKERQDDENLSKVAKSENEDDPTKDEDIEKLAKAIAQAADSNDTEEDAMDSLDDDEIKRILITLSGNDNEVDISPTRAARMDKMNKDLLDKEINGKSINDILADESNKEETKTTIPVASPNQDEWTDLSFINFDKNYNIEKDIINIFRHFSTCSRPISIRDIKVEDSSTSEDRTMLYDVSMEDYRGARFSVKLDIPIMEDNRFLLRGNYKSIQTQFFNMPIIKTESDTCQLITNYNKIFMYRFGSTAGKSSPIVARIVKAASKYTGRKIKFKSGYNLKVSNTYRLPIDYVDLSSIYNTIETENFILYFNQDEIRQNYVIEEGKGVPFAYHKQENAILYFRMDSDGPRFDELILDILMNADPNFTELFNAATRPTSCAYTRIKVMASMIPLAVVIGYYIGLRNMLDKAKISYQIINGNLPREIRNDYKKDWIKFEDGYVVYDIDYSANLLLNGLKQCSTDIFKLEEMDSRNMYLEFLDNFGGRIKADGLDNFRDLFIDPMIKESLEFYKLPTDYIDVLLYGNTLLADNKYIKHTDTSSRRFRRYQLIAAYTYKVLSSAYAYYANRLKHNSNAVAFEVKRSAVIDLFLTDNITSDDSVINALRDVETTNSITTKGPSGMNSDRAYSLDKRAYDDSMSNILGMSTGFAGNVGITRQATINSSVSSEGYTKSANGSTENMNDANTLTATEAMIPMSSTHDDPMRVAMSFVQTSKHAVRTEESDPLLITSGADEVMPYLTTNRFAFKAKMNGKIIDITDEYIIIEYDDGTKDMIDLREKTEKNSDGGYFVRLKLDPVEGLRKGMKIKQDQILAYDKLSFSNSVGEGENLAYNVGKLAKIAIINSDDGFEDSCIVTSDIAKAMATRIVIKYECVINADAKIFKFAKVGDHIEASDPLVIWEDAFDDEDAADIMAALSSGSTDFSDLGKRKLKAEVTGELVDIKIFRTVDTSEMSDTVKKIVNDYERPIKEMAKVANENGISKDKIPAYYTLPPTGKLKKSQNAIYVEFYVEYLDTVGAGDKICFFAANKTIVKNIIPEGKEPYTAFRPKEKIASLINSRSLDKRIVISVILSGAINKLLIEMDRAVKDIMGIELDDSKI